MCLKHQPILYLYFYEGPCVFALRVILTLKTATPFCLALTRRLERVYVGSYSLYVDLYSGYRACYRRRLDYYTLCDGFTSSVWSITFSVWSVAQSIWAVAPSMIAIIVSVWAIVALCGITHPLFGML